MLFIIPVDGQLLLLGLLSGRRRVVLCRALRDLLSDLLLALLVLGEGTALRLLAVPQPGQGP